MKNVLVIDDEESILELVRYNLEKNSFKVQTATSGEDGLDMIRKNGKPDLLLLDLMLPGISGLEVCKNLKSEPQTAKMPIVMLSALGEESDIVRGLEMGADDYIPKPFGAKVLVARVNAVIRRANMSKVPGEDVVELHGIRIDPKRHIASAEDQEMVLTATEFKLLHFLLTNAGTVYTRSQIVDSVKGEDYSVTERSVDVQVVGLRKKMANLGSLIETVRGVGYRFRE